MHDHNSPYSIERLVEFGLGMAVAQQMVRSMNSALTQMHVPGSMTPMLAHPSLATFVVLDGKSAGPFSDQELSRLIIDGQVTKASIVWRQGMAKWRPAEEVPEVLRLVALCPPPFVAEKAP